MSRRRSHPLRSPSWRTLAVVLASATAAVGCARPAPSSAFDRELDPSVEVTSGAVDAGPPVLDPAAAAAARDAVVLRPAALMLEPRSLPRSATLPPARSPTATPGAAETLMPVIPPGGAAPLMVPAETPVGLPLPPVWDGGAR